MMTVQPTAMTERLSWPDMAGPAQAGVGAAYTASDIWSMLRRRLVMISVMFGFFASLASAGFFVWWSYYPGYRSECLIECVSNIPASQLTLEHERLRQEEHERFVSTQALLLKSPGILGEALKIAAVRETRWYQNVLSKRDEPLVELTYDLTASPVRGTSFLRVALEAQNRQDPAVIVDAVVRLWLDTVKKRSSDEFATMLQTAQADLQAMDDRIETKRRELRTISSRLPPGVRMGPENSLAAQDARKLSETAVVLELETTQLAQFSTLYNSPEGVAVSAEDRSLVDQDLEILDLRRAMFGLEQQRAADLGKFGPRHSVIRQMDAQINAAKERLGVLESQKLVEIQSSNRESANTALENSRHALFLTQEKLLRAEAAMGDQDRSMFDYTNLESEITVDLENRRELNDYVKSLERVVRQRSAVDIGIAQSATDPLERSSPSFLLLPLGFFAALVVSTGLGLGLELMDKSVRTSQDIVRHLGVAMLGSVPHTDDEEVAIERVETAVRDAPRSMIAEAFRRIRTNLQYSAPAQRLRTVMVTSPHPGDGKTTVACNMAYVAAQGGRKVLLVDANFRRPGVDAAFGVGRSRGLSDILVGAGSLADFRVKTDAALLDLLLCGHEAPNPAELLGSENFGRLLEEAMATYDQIILDMPPALIAADALVVAAAVDGVVLVVRANESSRGAARRACGLITNVGGHLFGAVLNAAQAARGGYYREQLRSFYEYQEEPAKKSLS